MKTMMTSTSQWLLTRYDENDDDDDDDIDYALPTYINVTTCF